MTTIRIQCETCQATLRVRDQGFVGEVHACPRCGSMVLIAGAAPAPSEPAASADEVPEESVPEPVALGLSQTLETLEAPPIEPSASEPPPEKSEASLLAEAAAAPPRANLAPLLTTITALTATAVIGIGWLLAPAAELNEQPLAKQQVAPPAPEPEEASAPAETPGPSPIPAPAPTDPAPLPTADELPPIEPAPSEPEAPRVASRNEPVAARPPIAEPITREIDPLAFDPNQIDLALVGDAPPEPPAAKPPAPTILERPAAEPPPTRQVRDGVFVRLGSAGTLQPQPVDSALAQTVPRIELRGVPLAEACRLVGELAGKPVTLTPDALRRAGVTPSRPVDLIGEEQTLGDLFAAALKPVRLAYQDKGSSLVIVRQGADRQRTVTHRLADLVASDSPETLAARLSESVNASLAVSSAGELPLTAPMRTHYDLLVAAERLRLERDLPTSSKYPSGLLAKSPEELLGAKLDRRATFSFIEPTPLSEVFDYWRRATGTEVLVDWRALAGAGLGPRSTITCSATNRPWRAALSGVLEPLGLTWQPAFGPAIAIGVTEPSVLE